MGFKVIFAPQAIDQLSAIVKYVARDNPDAALRFGMKLVDCAAMLADFPELGTPFEKRANVRRLSCKPYFIYYRLNRQEQVVEIMDFWHSARRGWEFR